MKRFLRRYWGLVVLAILLTTWWRADTGPLVLLILSGLVTFWAAFQAPTWCGAANRPDQSYRYCRNNSRGLLMGCHLREHKWQKFKLLWYSRRWREFTRGWWATPSARLATVSGIVGIVSAVASPLAAL
jgi:hypothetical protein